MKYRMGEITGGEARELYPTRPVVLVPLGSHEDQGPHAPMGDYLSAERVAELIAERASAAGNRTVVAPVVPYGGADYFGSMPGGIALGQETLRAVLTDIFACLLRHNLSRIVVINGHGGNMQTLHEVTLDLWQREKCLIPSFYLWRIGYQLLPKIVGKEEAAKRAGHGADPLTSVAMHLFPSLMRPDMTPAPKPMGEAFGLPLMGLAAVNFDGAEIAMPLEVAQSAPEGVRGGDPRLCSAETGQKMVEGLVDLGARFVAHYAKQCP